MISEVIKELEQNKHQMNISKDSIELICKFKKSKILEIGTFNGYSALNLSLNSEKVVTLEKDPDFIELAKKNFEKAKVKNIELVEGDALDILKNLKENFDLVLIDAVKSQYKNYLELSLKLLNANGLIFADNTISHREHMEEFFNYLKNSNLYYKELNLGKGLMIIAKRIVKLK